MSLHVSDFHGPERTFQLLTQAAGRAGRGELPGSVVIQTYTPEHYSILAAKQQDYEKFYEQEIQYRKMLHYPPVSNLLLILCASKEEQCAFDAAALLAAQIEGNEKCEREKILPIGPADAAIAKISDVYKKVLYVKAENYQILVDIKDGLEDFMRDDRRFSNVTVQFDFNPADGF